MSIRRHHYSRFFIGIAALLLLVFGGTLGAPPGLAAVSFPEDSRIVSKLAAVTPQGAGVASCLCSSCDAHDKSGGGGGTCCCAGADTAGESLSFKVVCDTPLDAVSAGSPLPPAVLLPTLAVNVLSASPFLPGQRIVEAQRHPDTGWPLPPDAPPRVS